MVVAVVVVVVVAVTVTVMFHDDDALEWPGMGLLPNSFGVRESASNTRLDTALITGSLCSARGSGTIKTLLKKLTYKYSGNYIRYLRSH